MSRVVFYSVCESGFKLVDTENRTQPQEEYTNGII